MYLPIKPRGPCQSTGRRVHDPAEERCHTPGGKRGGPGLARRDVAGQLLRNLHVLTFAASVLDLPILLGGNSRRDHGYDLARDTKHRYKRLAIFVTRRLAPSTCNPTPPRLQPHAAQAATRSLRVCVCVCAGSPSPAVPPPLSSRRGLRGARPCSARCCCWTASPPRPASAATSSWASSPRWGRTTCHSTSSAASPMRCRYPSNPEPNPSPHPHPNSHPKPKPKPKPNPKP